MKIKYEFLTGEIVEVEVPEAIGEVAVALDRDIFNSNRRERRRHNSMENMQEKGHQLQDKRSNILFLLEQQELTEALHKALDKLLPQQQELIKKVFFEERTMAEIAREEGVNAKAIQDRIKKIKFKLRKIIENNLL